LRIRFTDLNIEEQNITQQALWVSHTCLGKTSSYVPYRTQGIEDQSHGLYQWLFVRLSIS
jgi:hypothetical protein